MGKTEKRKIGDIGEGVAVRYLENKGFSVLDRNYLKPWGEIDIVARTPKTLVFIEVKTVSREKEGWISRENSIGQNFRPEDNVHPAKLQRLYRAIQSYLAENGISEEADWRIDVACVYLDFTLKKAKVDVIENVTL